MDLNYAELAVITGLINKELEKDNMGIYERVLKELKEKIELELYVRINEKE